MLRTGRNVRPDALIALVALVGVVGYMIAAGLLGEVGFPLDDAWIHQTYARNLVQTGQWAFVPGEPSAGSTSPLYTLLLAVGYALRVPFLVWTMGLGWLALAAAGLTAARLGRQLGERLGADGRSAYVWSGVAVAATWHLVWAGASGMETALFAALTLGMVLLAWRELEVPAGVSGVRAALGRGITLGLMGVAAMLTRPEGAGLLALIGGLVWLVRPHGRMAALVAWTGGVVAGFVAGTVPYVLFNLSLGGDILPVTATAKQAEYAVLLAQPLGQRLLRLVIPILAGGQIALVPGMMVSMIAVFRGLRRDGRFGLLLLPVFWAVALVGVYALRLPVNYQHGRYVIPALPHLVVYGVVGTLVLSRHLLQRGMVGRVLGRSLVLIGVLLYAVFWGIGARQYAEDVQIIETEMVAAAQWLAANVPTDALLAVHDIGAVGYYASRPILDLAGLVSPEVIPLMQQPDQLWALMQARDVRVLMGFPEHVPGGLDATRHLCEVFSTNGQWAPMAGGANMAIYVIDWDGAGCESAAVFVSSGE